MASRVLHHESIPDLFKHALISFKANIRVLLVIAALSSLYNSAIDSSVGMFGISLNSTTGNISLDFDFQGKQNFLSKDAGVQTQEGRKPLFLDNLISSLFSTPSSEEGNRHVKESGYQGSDGLIDDRLTDTNGRHIQDTASSLPQLQEEKEGLNARLDFLQTDDSKSKSSYLNVRMVYPLKNDTQEEDVDNFEESQLGMFSGRLFGGGRGLQNQGGMPAGNGELLFAILFLLMSVLATLLVVIALRHSALLSAVAYTVVSTYMNKRVSIRRSARSGLRTGIWKLIKIASLHSVLRGMLCMFLMNFLFGKVLDSEQMHTLVLRLSVMPFAFQAPWKEHYSKSLSMSIRIGAFVTFDYIFDALTYSNYMMACWVAIVENQHRCGEAFPRGWNLIKTMPFQVAFIKVVESVLCGRSFKWMLLQVVGHFMSTLIISLLETFFLVLWLVLYFSARWKESQNQARQFSLGDLEDFLDRLR